MGNKKKSQGAATAATRPRTLLQRISSSFTSFLSLSSRRQNRATTAPVLQAQERLRTPLETTGADSHPIPRIAIPRLSGRNQIRSDVISRNRFLQSTEDASCSVCGLGIGTGRSSDISDLDGFCRNCRSRSQFSHMSFSYRPSRSSATGVSGGESSNHSVEPTISTAENIRLVSTSAATERAGNPARRISYPSGSRRPQGDTLQIPSSAHQQGTTRSPSRGSHDIHSISVRRTTRPVSPSLHHIHGLPSSKEFPYVHKHEVETHMIALRAGSPNPLRDRPRESRNNSTSPEVSVDYSRTVYYTRSATPSGSRSTPNPPRRSSQNTHGSHATARNTHRISPFQEELANSNVYRRRSPLHPTPRITDVPIDEESDSFSTLTTQTPSTVGGRRLELKGGSQQMPRLRGGAGRDSFFDRFSFKKLLLTCRGPRHDVDSSDDEPSLMGNTICDSATRYQRHDCSIYPWPLNTEQRLIARSILERAYLPRSGIDSARVEHMDTTADLSTNNQESSRRPPSKSQTSLRGSSGSPSTINNLRLPPTLYWLAGGKGSPIKVSSWKSQRGKKRMGGLWGMAVHGSKVGAEWDVKVETNSDADVEVKVEINGETVVDHKGVVGAHESGSGAKEDAGVGSSKRVQAEPDVGKAAGVTIEPTTVAVAVTPAEATNAAEPGFVPPAEATTKPASKLEKHTLDQDPFPEAIRGSGPVRDV